jgi:hypothetical protein
VLPCTLAQPAREPLLKSSGRTARPTLSSTALTRPGSSPSVKVAISEYVDVAHSFYEGEEPGLVNAVLDKVGRGPSPAGPQWPNART